MNKFHFIIVRVHDIVLNFNKRLILRFFAIITLNDDQLQSNSIDITSNSINKAFTTMS